MNGATYRGAVHSEGALPPIEVVRAFGASGDPVPLRGGLRQSAWRYGDIVVKPVEEVNPGEGDWVADALDAMVDDGFRVIRPVRSTNGAWLHHGWTAWRWLEGEHERSDWVSVVTATDAFHAELRRVVGDERPAWLDTREHRWARAERTVWHGAPLPPTINTGDLEWSMYHRAVALGPPLHNEEVARCQVVHGDVAGNVLVDKSRVHAFIDMSPGWRTPESSAVQVLIEAVAWFGADPSLLEGVDVTEAGRACAFRLLCGLQYVEDWVAVLPEEVKNWERVLRVLEA